MFSDQVLFYQNEVIKFEKKHEILEITPIRLVDKVSDKIPIWIYWHQGFDNAPEIVHMCINSLKENMPLDKVEIILLDENKLYNYIQILPEILENIKSNYTAYSDIIRFYLLYAYGGMYIDSTYLLVDKFPEENFKKDFWSIKTIYPMDNNFSLKMFTTNLMYTKQSENEIMLFMYRYMSSYWYYTDYRRIYDIIMGVCLYGYQSNKYPKHYINELDDNNTEVHHFCSIRNLNKIFLQKKYEEFKENNYFFKINRKGILKEYTDEDLTYWGYFKQRYLKGAN